MGVYAESAGTSDILAAIKQGHAFITFAPNGPAVEISAGEAMMGDSVSWNDVKTMNIHVSGLVTGDLLRVVTGDSSEVIFKAETDAEVTVNYSMAGLGFARIEILRVFIPGLPPLPALITNPIYFD